MKNILINSLIFLLAASPMFGQQMTWIPSDYSTYGGCKNLTDCDQNIVCYKLQYTPAVDGILTSYTTGFFADCQNSETTLLENQSCVMADNSRQVEACHQVGKILMNSSANSGEGPACVLLTGIPIILHQVCFQVADGTHVDIIEDETTDLTTSIDSQVAGAFRAATEFPSYQPYKTRNEQICAFRPSDIFIAASEKEPQVSILSWSPAGESGLGSYTIERSTDEGKTFVPIGQLGDRNFDIDLLTYELIDKDAAFGYNHYRASYDDGQGNVTISNIGSIYHFDGNFSAEIYPNPVEGLLQLNVNTGADNFDWTIIDQYGREILSGQEQGIHDVQIDLQLLSAGAYFLKVESGEQTTSEKFLKVR